MLSTGCIFRVCMEKKAPPKKSSKTKLLLSVCLIILVTQEAVTPSSKTTKGFSLITGNPVLGSISTDELFVSPALSVMAFESVLLSGVPALSVLLSAMIAVSALFSAGELLAVVTCAITIPENTTHKTKKHIVRFMLPP